MAGTNISRANGSGSATNKFTLSVWVKRGITDQGRMFSATGGSGDVYFRFNAGGVIEWSGHGSNASSAGYFLTNRLFRDFGSWYHFVIRFDSTQSTASDRLRFYVNGVQETSFSTSTNPNQDVTDNISLSSNTHYWGGAASSQYFDGMMTHMHYSNGYSYGPDTFGQTDSTSGIWVPKTAPSVTYGSQGYFLKFENSGAMGTDSSGNSNTFTVANGTLTQQSDTPSNVFAAWNPKMNNAEDGNWSNANLSISPNGDAVQIYAPITFPLSKGKWYSEHMITGGNGYGSLGLSGASNISDIFRTGEEPGLTAPSFAFRCINGGIKMNNANTSYGSAPGTSDAILGMAVDIDNKKVWYHVNGTYVTYGGGVGNPASGTYGFDWSSLSDDFGWLHVCGDSENNGYGNWKSNFGSGFFGTAAVASANADGNGQGAFEYAVPSGYYAICTKNIKEFG